MEFQIRGNPHIHSFIWIVNAPKLSSENIDEYTAWLDGLIKADLPNPETDNSLFELVKTYQIHRHSKSCRKYKNDKCRFNFGRFFLDRTIIAQLLSSDLSESQKKEILLKRKETLNIVSGYINEYLNPSKYNFYDPLKEDFVEPKSISEILTDLGVSVDAYYSALEISDDTDFQIHLRRPPNSCFVNNYFQLGLKAWDANMDIQPVINEYKAISYMCAYLSKTEDSCSNTMKQVLTESIEKRQNNFDQMRAIAHAYASNRECSVQEAVHHCLPELWLRKVFPRVIYAKTNFLEKRFKMLRSKEEIICLPDDNKNIFKNNILDRYMNRPDKSFLDVVIIL